MHSRIFQVGTTEIAPSDYIQPDDVSDRLCDNGVADYVDDVEDRAEELKYLLGSFKNIFVKGPGQFSFQISRSRSLKAGRSIILSRAISGSASSALR